MKIAILLLTPFIIYAASETLTTQEHRSIHNTNNRPIIKLQKKSKMHKLHKIHEQNVEQLAKQETGEKTLSTKLIHQGNHLLFKVETAHYKLDINALDGSIMKKEKKDLQ